MAAITQTITIVDKSNKVVTASKQLKNVFAEAKFAYQARKAEIKADRKRKEEVELQKAIQACSIAEDEAISRAGRNESDRRRRVQRDGHEGRPRNQHPRAMRSGSTSPRQMSLGQFNEQLYGTDRGQSPALNPSYEHPNQGLQRRRTDVDVSRRPSVNLHQMNRSYSTTDIDLDLAYGDFHEPDLAPSDYESSPRAPLNALTPNTQEKELNGLVLKCKKLLDEADCAGQSVKAIISHLQENPDAMAAVALTLAEISNIASKVAPGALTALKGTAPAVIALLASPEFLVAVGVGIGVTIVMFGGYKIIKKIKASASGNADADPVSLNGAPRQVNLAPGGELLDVKELDRIENWRRGIADGGLDESGSVISGYSNATSVEGEFITPFAAQSMGHLPLPKTKKRHDSSKKDKDGKKEKKRSSRKDRDAGSTSDSGSTKSSSNTESGSRRRRGDSAGKELIKVSKKPSPLRRMFTVQNTSSVVA